METCVAVAEWSFHFGDGNFLLAKDVTARLDYRLALWTQLALRDFPVNR